MGRFSLKELTNKMLTRWVNRLLVYSFLLKKQVYFKQILGSKNGLFKASLTPLQVICP